MGKPIIQENAQAGNTKMWTWLNDALNEFRGAFNNKKTFGWFVIIIIGMMIRTESVGLTSIVRILELNAASYPLILNFFRSEACMNFNIEIKWQMLLSKLPFLYRLHGKTVLIGDGIKKSKEGRYMPGVKKLHQESGNSAKGEYIFGHMFGGLGVLIGNPHLKMYCVLVSMRIHDGLKSIHAWYGGEDYIEESHVVKMIMDAQRAKQVFGDSILLLDRLFLTVPMLKALAASPGISVVTKAKSNAKAYYLPEQKKGPGAPRKKGEDVKVISLFQTLAASFVTAEVFMYGKKQKVSYHHINLKWGDTWYQELRFVLVDFQGTKTILVSTDLTLTAEEISLALWKWLI